MPKLLTQGVSSEPETGRSLIGIVAGFKSERWPDFDRNGGRLQIGIRTLTTFVPSNFRGFSLSTIESGSMFTRLRDCSEPRG